jgi:NAD(P)H-dependent flavin oxidoreductase YrpB (nitropropane dioxygenase family)
VSIQSTFTDLVGLEHPPDGCPVLAAGGIATGAQMAAGLAVGAAGVWCGSVWLNSFEDITPLPIKQKLLSAGSADTIRSPLRTGKSGGNFAVPATTNGRRTVSLRYPCRYSQCLSTRPSIKVTLRLPMGTLGRWNRKLSSSARWWAHSTNCVRQLRLFTKSPTTARLSCEAPQRQSADRMCPNY